MNKSKNVAALTISQTVDQQLALYISSREDGSIKRIGNGGPFHGDYTLYEGNADKSLFEQLRAELPSECLHSPVRDEDPSRLGPQCVLTVAVEIKGQEDAVTEHTYGLNSKCPPSWLAKYVKLAVRLSDDWWLSEQRAAGVDNDLDPSCGREYARELPPEGHKCFTEPKKPEKPPKSKAT